MAEDTELTFEDDLTELAEEIKKQTGKKPYMIRGDGTSIKMAFHKEVTPAEIEKISTAVKTQNPIMKHTKTAKIDTSSSKGEKKVTEPATGGE
jgi:hypothetical protein